MDAEILKEALDLVLVLNGQLRPEPPVFSLSNEALQPPISPLLGIDWSGEPDDLAMSGVGAQPPISLRPADASSCPVSAIRDTITFRQERGHWTFPAGCYSARIMQNRASQAHRLRRLRAISFDGDMTLWDFDLAHELVHAAVGLCRRRVPARRRRATP
jgi:hypothetical protein